MTVSLHRASANVDTDPLKTSRTIGTKGHMQPAVMAPKTLSKHYGSNRNKPEKERQKTQGKLDGLYNLTRKAINTKRAEPTEGTTGEKGVGVGVPRSSGVMKTGGYIGSESATDELSKHFGYSGVIAGGPEVQGLGKGPSNILAGRAAEYSMCSGLDFLLAPRGKASVPGDANSDGPGDT